jgi:hypothetical protein
MPGNVSVPGSGVVHRAYQAPPDSGGSGLRVEPLSPAYAASAHGRDLRTSLSGGRGLQHRNAVAMLALPPVGPRLGGGMEKVDYDARLHAAYAAGRQMPTVH